MTDTACYCASLTPGSDVEGAADGNRSRTAGSDPGGLRRNATGLRKESGAFDIFVYNTNNQNIGLGVAFLFLAVGSYAGGSSPSPRS